MPKKRKQIQIAPEMLSELIRNTAGKFFTVHFVKKDGTPRIMNARLGVAYNRLTNRKVNQSWKLVKGCKAAYDVQKKAYRTINLTTTTLLRVSGTDYLINRQ